MNQNQLGRAIRCGVWMALAGILVFGGAVHGATTWHVSTSGDDSFDGLSWGGALASISNAVAKAVTPEDVVLVSNGTYQSYATIEITNGITLKSVNGAAVTIVDAGNRSGVGGLRVLHADAVVEGFTLKRGYTTDAGTAGGVYMTGGIVRWCRILENYGNNHSGSVEMTGGLMHHCIIQDGKYANWNGTMLISGSAIVRNCLISNNSYRRGGGIFMSGNARVENCTVVANSAGEHFGGIRRDGGTVVNTIVYFNTDPTPTGDNHNSPASGFTYSCSTPLPAGTGNILDAPEFVNVAARNFRLTPASPAIGKGTTNLTWLADNPAEVDLDGNPRGVDGSIDMGAYQYTAGALDCGFFADVLSGVAPLESQFTSVVAGTNTTGLTYYWDFNGDGTIDSNDPHPIFSFDSGTFTVSLTVSNAVGEGATYSRTDYVMAYPATLHASKTGSNTFPYDTSDKAAASVLDAIAAAGDGSLVLVGPGEYTHGSAINLTKGIILRSQEGREETTLIVSAGNTRTVYISHPDALVDGFTIKRSGSDGGGVRIHNFGAIENCDIIGGRYAHSYGANLSMNGGVARNLDIRDGEDRHIGGVRLENGAYLDHSVIVSNHATLGGGASVAGSVGGVRIESGSTLRNSLIHGNWVVVGSVGAGLTGGALLINGLLENCTIVGNTAATNDLNAAGGLRIDSGTARNTIINYNDNSFDEAELNWYRSGGTIEYTLTTPSAAALGDENINGEPNFIDSGQGDFRLQHDSLGVNAGLNDPSWMIGAVDLAGNPRISGSRVDMGAYEFHPPAKGSQITLR